MKLLTPICLLLCVITACSEKDNSIHTTVWNCNAPLNYVQTPFVFSLPTVFTPNGDGKNDVYRPVGTYINGIDYLMAIYKPNGVMIFKTTDYKTGWNGRDSSGNLVTDYSYGVTVHFTNNQGQLVDTCTQLWLLTNNTNGCAIRTADSAQYIFEDQINPATGKAAYPTAEVFCK